MTQIKAHDLGGATCAIGLAVFAVGLAAVPLVATNLRPPAARPHF